MTRFTPPYRIRTNLNLFNGDRAWNLAGGRSIPNNIPESIRLQIFEFDRRFASHHAVHVLDPSTFAYGLSDSPVGMLAWILERWVRWSDNKGDVEGRFHAQQRCGLIVKITSTAICGSNLHLIHGMIPNYVIGHEPMGIVEEVGPGVTKVKKGDRVIIPFNIACGECFLGAYTIPTIFQSKFSLI